MPKQTFFSIFFGSQGTFGSNLVSSKSKGNSEGPCFLESDVIVTFWFLEYSELSRFARGFRAVSSTCDGYDLRIGQPVHNGHLVNFSPNVGDSSPPPAGL